MAQQNKLVHDFKQSFLRVDKSRRESSIINMTKELDRFDPPEAYKGISQYEELKANLDWAKENIDEPQTGKEEESE